MQQNEGEAQYINILIKLHVFRSLYKCLLFRHHVEHVNRSSISRISSTGVQKSSLTVQSSARLYASSRFGHFWTRVTIPSSVIVISTRVNILFNFAEAFTSLKHSNFQHCPTLDTCKSIVKVCPTFHTCKYFVRLRLFVHTCILFVHISFSQITFS